jgi:hypothetical protein
VHSLIWRPGLTDKARTFFGLPHLIPHSIINNNMGSTKNSNKQQEQQPAASSRKPVKPVELRCKLCNSEGHRSVQCEDRCRGTRCVELKLHTHAWAECPFKTRPFCQLCGDTDHGVFKHDCIHRCYVHDSWVHHIGHCPTFCDDCGLSGHRARSQVCTMRNRRRTTARRTSAPAAPAVEPVAPQKPKQQKAAAAAGLPAPEGVGLGKKGEGGEDGGRERWYNTTLTVVGHVTPIFKEKRK